MRYISLRQSIADMRFRLLLCCARSGLQYVAQLFDEDMASKQEEKASNKQKRAGLGDKIQAVVSRAGLTSAFDVHSPSSLSESDIPANEKLYAWQMAAVEVLAQTHGPTFMILGL